MSENSHFPLTGPDQPTETVGALLDILHGSWKTQAICTAAELQIADHLANGCRDIADLAVACGCHAPSLRRLLQALTSLGICLEHDDGSISLTPMGACLRSDGEDSIRSWVIWWGKHLLPVWGQLPYSVRSGKEARSKVTGVRGFGQLAEAPELAGLFHASMTELTRLVSRELVKHYDFSGFGRIADLGGGHGELLATILENVPDCHGLLFDLPHAIDGARQYLDARGLLARCELVEGDFFRSVPDTADIYIMKSVLHDWDDDRAASLLANCRSAMRSGARLLLVEHIMPERLTLSAEHQSLARLDLSMLVALGARERTEGEYRDLLDKSGLRVSRILPVGMAFYIIEAVPQ